MKNHMTVAEFIEMLDAVEDKSAAIEFHPISECAYMDTIVRTSECKYTHTVTVTIK